MLCPDKCSILSIAGIYFLYHNRVILVCRIFFWSWKMPYMRASEVGGPEKPMSAIFYQISLAMRLTHIQERKYRPAQSYHTLL